VKHPFRGRGWRCGCLARLREGSGDAREADAIVVEEDLGGGIVRESLAAFAVLLPVRAWASWR